MEYVINVIQLLGGLALFLYGMSVMGSSLEKASNGKMQMILEKLTNNVVKSVCLGAVVTALVQSSSATTVVVVGLVNAGVLKLNSAVGVIMGANIGTTITGQLLRLGDLDSGDNVSFILDILKPKVLSPAIALVGILLFMVAKRNKFKTIGEIMLGFGVLFNGMFAMEGAVSGLSENETFRSLFKNLSNPVLGVIVGALVTALIQSSSASVGILQALSTSKIITYSAAFPIIMGQNIGTCITPIMSSIGANKNAKRTAMVHLYFNIIGTVFFLTIFYLFQYLVGFSFWDKPIDRGGIADFHTLFNIVVTMAFLPFSNLLAKLACMTIRDKENTSSVDEVVSLDDRFLKSPSIAIQQSMKAVIKMGKFAQLNFRECRPLITKYDEKAVERIRENEASIDKMEDMLNHYLLKLNDCVLSDSENRDVTAELHLLAEFERIGDYTINIVECAEQMYNKQVKFSRDAVSEFNIMCDAIDEIIELAITSVTFNDEKVAMNIEPLEEVVDKLTDFLKSKHIKRFKSGQCAVDAGVIFLDILTNLERISDHCSNIGVYLIMKDEHKDTVNRHEYVESLHEGKSQQFLSTKEMYSKKYSLS